MPVVFLFQKKGLSLMKSYHSKDVIHAGFEIGLLFKGIDGLLEIIGGVFLIFLSPQRLNHLLFLFTKSELSEDPRDMISNFLINFASSQTTHIHSAQFRLF